jgi:membrane associated rhomboid family serine protease
MPGSTPGTARCYRHPNRETRLGCSRCGRPICPECSIPAPVGFHCPACVDEARRRTAPARTQFGGVVQRAPRRVTSVLIGLNAAVYVLTLLGGSQALVSYGMAGVPIALGDWWRLFTAPFLHATLWHIGLNMLALWILGGVLEPLLGRARFLAVYLLAALGGATASYLFSDPRLLSVGASGAVFGLLGGVLVALRRLNRDVSGVVVLLMINVVFGFLVPNIDWRAHLGGLLVGAGVTAAFVYAPRRLRTPVAWATVAAVLVVLAVAVGWRTDQILALLA